jgi:hypothetical protein
VFLEQIANANEMTQEKAFRPALLDMLFFYHYGQIGPSSVWQSQLEYPVFVVWKTIKLPGKPQEKKGRVVVDIRGLNKNSEDDPYPMPLQSDIIAAVQGANYISTMDVPQFFYAWPVRTGDQHCFTVVTQMAVTIRYTIAACLSSIMRAQDSRGRW